MCHFNVYASIFFLFTGSSPRALKQRARAEIQTNGISKTLSASSTTTTTTNVHMTLKLIADAPGTPPHRLAHARTHRHSFTTRWRSSRTPRGVRSADPLPPSLPPSSRRIACAADDSQSHRAARARLHAERLHQGERTASAAWEFFFLALPTSPFASLLYFPHSFLVGSPIVEGGSRRALRRGAPGFLTPASCGGRRCGETNWKFAQARFGVVFFLDFPLSLSLAFFF